MEHSKKLVYDFLKEHLEKIDPCLVCQIFTVYVDKWWSRALRRPPSRDRLIGNGSHEIVAKKVNDISCHVQISVNRFSFSFHGFLRQKTVSLTIKTDWMVNEADSVEQ